jgi:hypothetical protein
MSDMPTVATFISEVDGVTCVQIDTDGHEGRIRVYLNEDAIWDADPE